MGRLGFNLVGQKDIEKVPTLVETLERAENVPVVETVVVVDKLQNQRNENSEESRLRSKIQAKNLTIAKLRALTMCLVLGLIFIIGLMICFTLPQECSEPLDKDALLQLIQEKFSLNEEEAFLITNFLGARENRPEAARLEMQADSRMMAINCTASLGELEQLQADKKILEKQLSDQKSLFKERDDDAMHKYNLLQESFAALQIRHEALAVDFADKQQEMHAEVEKLQEERADLEKKIEAGNKKLQQLQQRNSRQQQRQQQQQAAVKTTTEPPSRSIFDNGQMKKFNDLVKDIETGAVLYDFNSFLKRTDEVFRL